MSEESRFSWIEIDDNTPRTAAAAPVPVAQPAPAPVVAPAPAPAPTGFESVIGGPAIPSRRAAVAPARPVAAPAPATVEAPRAVAAQIAPGAMIAVQQADETTGSVTYWQLSGAVSLAALTAAWADQGLDASWLPAANSREVALTRAARGIAGAEVLVRKHPAGGWAVVLEQVRAGELVYEQQGRAHLDDAGALQMALPEVHASAIRGRFERALAELESTDVSDWLVGLARRLQAQCLRDRGGIYFFQRDTVPTLRKIKAALTACTHHVVHEIPALRSGEVVAAVFDAVQREAQQLIATLEAELLDTQSPLGPRARATRTEEIDAMLSKIRSYEALLGQHFVAAREKLNAVRAELAKKATRGELLEVR